VDCNINEHLINWLPREGSCSSLWLYSASTRSIQLLINSKIFNGFKIIVGFLLANRCRSRGRRNNVLVYWMVPMCHFHDFVRARSSRLCDLSIFHLQPWPCHLAMMCGKLVNSSPVPSSIAMAETCLDLLHNWHLLLRHVCNLFCFRYPGFYIYLCESEAESCTACLQ